MSVFDDNLWDGIQVKKVEKKEGQNFNSFWDISKGDEPSVLPQPVKKEEPTPVKQENKNLKQEPVPVKQEIAKVEKKEVKETPKVIKEEKFVSKVEKTPVKEIPKENVKIEKEVLPTIPTEVLLPPITDVKYEYEENYNYILQERVDLEEVEDYFLESSHIQEENKKFIQNSSNLDQNQRISSLQEQNQKLLEKISQLEDKSLKIIKKYKSNNEKLSNQIKKLNNALYTSSKIALSTTNSGKHLSIVGKDLAKIPEIYQDKLGGVVESLDLSWNKIR